VPRKARYAIGEDNLERLEHLQCKDAIGQTYVRARLSGEERRHRPVLMADTRLRHPPVLTCGSGENGVAGSCMHEPFLGLHGAGLVREAHLHFPLEFYRRNVARIVADCI
jgi:hypothetical protein